MQRAFCVSRSERMWQIRHRPKAGGCGSSVQLGALLSVRFETDKLHKRRDFLQRRVRTVTRADIDHAESARRKCPKRLKHEKK